MAHCHAHGPWLRRPALMRVADLRLAPPNSGAGKRGSRTYGLASNGAQPEAVGRMTMPSALDQHATWGHRPTTTSLKANGHPPIAAVGAS